MEGTVFHRSCLFSLSGWIIKPRGSLNADILHGTFSIGISLSFVLYGPIMVQSIQAIVLHRTDDNVSRETMFNKV